MSEGSAPIKFNIVQPTDSDLFALWQKCEAYLNPRKVVHEVTGLVTGFHPLSKAFSSQAFFLSEPPSLSQDCRFLWGGLCWLHSQHGASSGMWCCPCHFPCISHRLLKSFPCIFEMGWAILPKHPSSFQVSSCVCTKRIQENTDFLQGFNTSHAWGFQRQLTNEDTGSLTENLFHRLPCSFAEATSAACKRSSRPVGRPVPFCTFCLTEVRITKYSKAVCKLHCPV